jgi:hypothetical protein
LSNATPVTTPRLEKLFILRAWLIPGGPDTKDNAGDLEKEIINNGWSVDCYETVLADTTHGICYILVKLSKPITP